MYGRTFLPFLRIFKYIFSLLLHRFPFRDQPVYLIFKYLSVYLSGVFESIYTIMLYIINKIRDSNIEWNFPNKHKF